MAKQRHRIGWWVLVLVMTAGMGLQAEEAMPAARDLTGVIVTLKGAGAKTASRCANPEGAIGAITFEK